MNSRARTVLVCAHGFACGCLVMLWMTAPGILATGILSDWHFREQGSTVLVTIAGLVITIAWSITTRRWVFKQLERSLDWLLDRVRR